MTCGFSAGGYLVCLWNTPGKGYAAFGLPKPEACIPVYPFVSPKLELTREQDGEEDEEDENWDIRLYGCPVREAVKQDFEIPEHAEGFPPSAFFLAAGDELVNPDHSRILAAALEMFSQKGYEGTNIRELSASLGLVKSGIYKHFESKEAIWNALLDRMIAYYGERFGSPEHLPPVPDSTEAFIMMTMQMANLTIRDSQIVKTRKVLTLEQFRDNRARELATKHFLTGLTEMFTHVFTGMMN
jgi:hypothetical protein